MTITYVPATTPHRPTAVSITIGTLVFLALSALAGSVMLIFTSVPADSFPADWLDRLPLIDSWLVPGLVLGIGFGLGSLLAAYGVLYRPRLSWLRFVDQATHHHWSWTATVLLGVGQIAWIVIEVSYLGFGLLHAVYGTVGLLLVLLPLLPPMRGYLATPPPDPS